MIFGLVTYLILSVLCTLLVAVFFKGAGRDRWPEAPAETHTLFPVAAAEVRCEQIDSDLRLPLRGRKVVPWLGPQNEASGRHHSARSHRCEML